MHLIRDISEVFEATQKAKARAPAFYYTNFFPGPMRLQGWIEQGELYGAASGGLALFLRKDRDFHHLYFCAADADELPAALRDLPAARSERLAVDLVGTEASLGPLLAVFGAAGFRPYACLCRMARMVEAGATPARPARKEIVYADPGDSAAILELLDRSFDRYAEQLPMHYEVKIAVEARQILLARLQGAIEGLLCFETHGLTSILRYWLVAERVRAQGLGSALLRTFLAMHGSVRRFILWVIANNQDATAKYSHYGFAPDGLVDQVLVNHLISK